MTTISAGHPWQEAFESLQPQASGSEGSRAFYGGLDVRVIVARNIPPRDPQFEYWQERGRSVICQLFDHKTERPTITASSLFMCFPERFASVHERPWLFVALGKAERPNLTRVDVITSDVFIVQSASSVGIIHDDRYFYDQDRSGWWFTEDS